MRSPDSEFRSSYGVGGARGLKGLLLAAATMLKASSVNSCRERGTLRMGALNAVLDIRQQRNAGNDCGKSHHKSRSAPQVQVSSPKVPAHVATATPEQVTTASLLQITTTLQSSNICYHREVLLALQPISQHAVPL